MKFISDVKNGAKALKPYLGLFPGDWEFIAWGESAEDPYQASDCAFFFQRAKKKNVYGLQLVNGDGTAGGQGDREEEADATIVAVLVDPPTDDPNEIVPMLLDGYREHGGKYIELYSRTGKYMLP